MSNRVGRLASFFLSSRWGSLTLSPTKNHLVSAQRLLMVVVTAFGIANVIAAPIFLSAPSQLVEACIAGMLISEFVLLAVWFPLAPDSIWNRVAGTIAIGMLWFGCWMTGWLVLVEFRVNGDWYFWLTLDQLLALPLICLATQLPFWLLRFCCQWGFRRPNDTRPVQRESISIKTLLAATLIVAVSLGLVRLRLWGIELVSEEKRSAAYSSL